MNKIPFYASNHYSITEKWKNAILQAFDSIAKEDNFMKVYSTPGEIPQSIPDSVVHNGNLPNYLYKWMKDELPEELTSKLNSDAEDACSDMLYRAIVMNIGHVLVSYDWLAELIHAMEEYTGKERHNIQCLDLTGGAEILATAMKNYGCVVTSYDCYDDDYNIAYPIENCYSIGTQYIYDKMWDICMKHGDTDFILIHEPMKNDQFTLHAFLRMFHECDGNTNVVVLVIGDGTILNERDKHALQPENNFRTQFINKYLKTIPRRGLYQPCTVRAYHPMNLEYTTLFNSEYASADDLNKAKKWVQGVVQNVYEPYLTSIAGYYGLQCHPMWEPYILAPHTLVGTRAFDKVIMRTLLSLPYNVPIGFCDVRFVGAAGDYVNFELITGFKRNIVDMNWMEVLSQMIHETCKLFNSRCKSGAIDIKSYAPYVMHPDYKINIHVTNVVNGDDTTILNFILNEFTNATISGIDGNIGGYASVTVTLYDSKTDNK